jgi:hypothetical protein
MPANARLAQLGERLAYIQEVRQFDPVSEYKFEIITNM